MANYPTTVKIFPTLVDFADSLLASHQNDRGGEITAVETELGVQPKGSDASVAARLSRMETESGKAIEMIQGGMVNGKIVTSVASNNLTAAVKTLAGADPSAGDPVYVRIGNTVRSITAALSVTKNAGTNWCNAGSGELATKEVDYFVYLGYNATDGVVIGFSRIPYSRRYGDFSTTSTDGKYAAISTITSAVSTDEYEVVGRFNATLSAGAGYTWSIPATSIVISRPIFETRWLSWQPTYTATGSMTFTTVTTTQAVYKISGENVMVSIDVNGTTGGTASYAVQISAPITMNTAKMAGVPYLPCYIIDSTKPGGYLRYAAASFDGIQAERLAEDNWGLGSGRYIRGTLIYAI